MEKMGLLGPLGTFTEEATVKYSDKAGVDFDKIVYRTISDVFRAVESGEVSRGVVPIENLLNGHVLETLDNLYKTDLKIQDVIVLPINHCLAVRPDVLDIEVVKSHPQALAQCSDYLDANYSDAARVAASSTAGAMEEVAEGDSRNSAAIGSALVAKRYGLNVAREGIGNNKDNKTMFVVIGEGNSIKSERNRTSLVMIPSKNKPGVLDHMLRSFAGENVDLKMIQSRPDGKGGYVFYVDVEGHVSDDNVAKSLEHICEDSKIKVFGSYPYASLSGL